MMMMMIVEMRDRLTDYIVFIIKFQFISTTTTTTTTTKNVSQLDSNGLRIYTN